MKKLFFLFLAITINSCSKDDKSDSANFTEKYDDVVWSADDTDGRTYFMAFSFDQNILNLWDDTFGDCDIMPFSIEEVHSENIIVLIDDDDKWMFVVINNGDNLNILEYAQNIDDWELMESLNHSNTTNHCM